FLDNILTCEGQECSPATGAGLSVNPPPILRRVPVAGSPAAEDPFVAAAASDPRAVATWHDNVFDANRIEIARLGAAGGGAFVADQVVESTNDRFINNVIPGSPAGAAAPQVEFEGAGLATES